MRELLHHFGFIDNRVQVGVASEDPEAADGLVLSTCPTTHQRELTRFMVDHPHKLKTPSNGMVSDIVRQMASLGVTADMVELRAPGMVFTYQAADNRVQLVSKESRHQ